MSSSALQRVCNPNHQSKENHSNCETVNPGQITQGNLIESIVYKSVWKNQRSFLKNYFKVFRHLSKNNKNIFPVSLLHNSKENYTQFNFSVPLSLIFYYNYLRGRLAWQNSYPVNNDLLCIEVMSHMVRQQGHKERDEEFTFTEGLFSYAADI